MTKQKVQAYILFRNEIRDQQRGTMAPAVLWNYVNEKWNQLNPESKAVYRAKAALYNAELLKAKPLAAEKPVEEVPLDLLPIGAQMIKRAEMYLNFCGRERIMLMNRRFVSMCVNPVFKVPLAGSGMDYLPGEIGLVRWSIASGLEQVYHVFIDPGRPKNALTVTFKEWNECVQMTACKDIDIIADEIVEFIGSAGAVLIRPAMLDRSTRCFSHILKDTKVAMIDQSAVLHILLSRELCTKKNEKINIKEIRDMFPAKTGITGVGVTAKGEHTGIRCAWHPHNMMCPARRVVEDSYIMVKELSSVYQAKTVPGKHHPEENFLVPRKFHNCRQQVDLCLLMGRLKASGQAASK